MVHVAEEFALIPKNWRDDGSQVADYSPVSGSRILDLRRKRVAADPVSELLKDFDRRSFVLRTLREAGRPIATAECALAFARKTVFGEDYSRLDQIGNRLCQNLDQLAQANRAAGRKGRWPPSSLGGSGVAVRIGPGT